MAFEIVSNPARVWAYLNQRGACVPVIAGMKGIGLERDGELRAGVLYETYNGTNIWLHVAVSPGVVLPRSYIRYCFYYPFVELNCARISGYVEASNAAARRFDEWFGFEQEAVLRGAASDGGDVILYVLWRHKCRFLTEEERGRKE